MLPVPNDPPRRRETLPNEDVHAPKKVSRSSVTDLRRGRNSGRNSSLKNSVSGSFSRRFPPTSSVRHVRHKTSQMTISLEGARREAIDVASLEIDAIVSGGRARGATPPRDCLDVPACNGSSVTFVGFRDKRGSRRRPGSSFDSAH